MGMAAVLVMWPGPFEQTFVPPSRRSSIWNMTDWPIGFREEDVKRVWTTTTYDGGLPILYKFTNEPSAQVS